MLEGDKKKEYMREYMEKKRKGLTNGSNKSGSNSDGSNKLNLTDLGVDLKELGVQSCGPGLPIIIRNDITVSQVQGLVKVIQAMNGDLGWEPRCGMGKSF